MRSLDSKQIRWLRSSLSAYLVNKFHLQQKNNPIRVEFEKRNSAMYLFEGADSHEIAFEIIRGVWSEDDRRESTNEIDLSPD